MPVPFIDHAIVPMYRLTAAAHHCQGSSIELSSAGLQQQACWISLCMLSGRATFLSAIGQVNTLVLNLCFIIIVHVDGLAF